MPSEFLYDPIEKVPEALKPKAHLYLQRVSKKTVIDHLIAIVWYLLRLNLLKALDHATWSIQRCFKVGIYKQNGVLDKYGIRWRTKDPDPVVLHDCRNRPA